MLQREQFLSLEVNLTGAIPFAPNLYEVQLDFPDGVDNGNLITGKVMMEFFCKAAALPAANMGCN